MDNIRKDIDLYRDTALRYCGYANEVGEALRPLIPKKVVHLSYGVAVAYVIGDCIDKTGKTYKKPKILGGQQITEAAKTCGDVFLWQMLASVIIPGFVINRVTWGTGYLMKRNKKLPSIARKWLPTIVGLAAIPLIIRPIDNAVDHAMDRTYRKYV
ncbi:mitochondrial fission process protein 1 [Contarinia nasturtii]|uniref:mitochondrial fission process protein 1 n=1 Tax=Contarinia nasturtii TaxID=265458 RepID=UPI0012D39B43|nr:mitochondrial fission process protein 1 [Contarinia nasturtii]